jgi:hypothetical protein
VDNSGSLTPKPNIAVSKYFRDKAGLFSWFSTVAILPEYKNKDTVTKSYIIKVLYKVGSQKADNYYLGKVQIDSNSVIIKELYDKKAVENIDLLKSEFGGFFADIVLYQKFKDYR